MKLSKISKTQGTAMVAALAIAKLGLSLTGAGNATPLSQINHQYGSRAAIVSPGEQQLSPSLSGLKVATVTCIPASSCTTC